MLIYVKLKIKNPSLLTFKGELGLATLDFSVNHMKSAIVII